MSIIIHNLINWNLLPPNHWKKDTMLYFEICRLLTELSNSLKIYFERERERSPCCSTYLCIHWLILFFKLYFTDHAITVVLIFPPLPPSTQYPLLPQALPTPFFKSTGHAYKFFGSSISHTVLYTPMAILQLPICTS